MHWIWGLAVRVLGGMQADVVAVSTAQAAEDDGRYDGQDTERN